jgi:hypothetical protein
MSQADPRPPEPTPWDRFGSFLGDIAGLTSSIADRNARLWMTAAPNVAGGSRAGQPPADWSEWIEIARQNAQDVYSFWMGLTPGQRVAYPVPLVAIEFVPTTNQSGQPRWMLTPQTLIPVYGAPGEQLPEFARVELSGGDDAGASALVRCLRVRLGNWRLAYEVESFDVRDLHPGVYTGVVSVDTPDARPIASLHVVVRPEEPLSIVPVVTLTWRPRYGEGGDAGGNGGAGGDRPPVHEAGEWTPHGPIPIPAALGRPARGEPQITLVGEQADALVAVLRVTVDPAGGGHLLAAGTPPAGVGGTYVGIVVADGRPLASLQISVDQRTAAGG